MKINYRPLIKGTNWALAGILGILGFSKCDDITNNKMEYGTPKTDYVIKGAVVDKASGKPIKGIKVNIVYEPILMYGTQWTDYSPKEAVIPEAITDETGEFMLMETSVYGIKAKEIIEQKFPVAITDIDGEKNGSFESNTLYIDYEGAIQTKKGKGWYDGEYTKTVNVELTEKKDNE
jgi:putative lipoprotein (rSAM/lipoprotein system)